MQCASMNHNHARPARARTESIFWLSSCVSAVHLKSGSTFLKGQSGARTTSSRRSKVGASTCCSSGSRWASLHRGAPPDTPSLAFPSALSLSCAHTAAHSPCNPASSPSPQHHALIPQLTQNCCSTMWQAGCTWSGRPSASGASHRPIN